ncbi:MAG TPA: 3-dehydroquinate synthase [Bdellovibrionota bacterium]|nr:3-dehydroquinate synthase [Bdellovibrionota bacterium]
MKRIHVALDGRSYDVCIGHHLFRDNATLPLKGYKERRAFFFADARLKRVLPRIEKVFRNAGWKTKAFFVPGGEQVKDFKGLYPLYGSLLRAGADRNSVIVAVGGGSIGDAIGFVAGTFLRGLEWINIPTTLLAQVDSAIGGKTGMNHESGKNLIGVFHQPRLVLCDLDLLLPLSARDRVSGFGEIAKYAVIYDRKLFTLLERNWKQLLELDPKIALPTISRCAILKSGVIQKDELDRKGTREVLNFGHTVGHAIETRAGYGYYRHGEAVLLGMRVEAALSVMKGHLEPRVQKRIDRFLSSVPVPPIPKSVRAKQISESVRLDKKKAEGKVRFVLLKDIGTTVLDTSVTPAEISRALRSIGIH